MRRVVVWIFTSGILAFSINVAVAQIPSLSDAKKRVMAIAKASRFSGEIAFADEKGDVI